MFLRLRPTTRSEGLVAEWSATASVQHRQRLVELLETLEDGRWRLRWWNRRYSSDPDVWEIRFDTNAHLFFRIILDEEDGLPYADFISIVLSEPRDPDDEDCPDLGEG